MVHRGFDDMSLTPGTASESAERYVRALIFWGELGPGDRLPPATELAALLGISRVTLRIALRSLESAGYLVTTRGAHGGSRVSDVRALQKCWHRWMTEHSGELDDIFEFRITIERRLAELAAERRTAPRARGPRAGAGRGARQPPARVTVPGGRRHPPQHRRGGAQPSSGAGHERRARRPLPACGRGPAGQHRGRRLLHARGHRRRDPRPGPGAGGGRGGDSRAARPSAPRRAPSRRRGSPSAPEAPAPDVATGAASS